MGHVRLPMLGDARSVRCVLTVGLCGVVGIDMAYEGTEVSVGRSQEALRRIIYKHDGTGVSFISQSPREGFEALVTMQDFPYHIRVMATCRERQTPTQKEQEERRVWRVLFHHLKAIFEAADSGVIDIRDVIMPYVVTPDGRTIAEHLAPRMKELTTMNSARLLEAGGLSR